jgi:hypothetical protein
MQLGFETNPKVFKVLSFNFSIGLTMHHMLSL